MTKSTSRFSEKAALAPEFLFPLKHGLLEWRPFAMEELLTVRSLLESFSSSPFADGHCSGIPKRGQA